MTQKQRRAIALKIIHRTDLISIKKTDTTECHICGKPDWCMVYTNPQTGLVEADLCNRPESTPDHLTQEGKAVFVRWDKWDQQSTPLKPTFKAKSKEKSQPKKAKASTLNRVYRHILNQLKLSDQHQQQLVDRGLTIEQIKRLGYRTAPTYSQLPALMRSLKETGVDLLSVPGFYTNKQGFPWLENIPGLWIPYHNYNNQIVGVQIRVDQARNGGKYIWLSGSSKGGIGCGTPIHVAKADTDTVWITEGALKADIASAYLNQTVMAMAGVSSYKEDELQQTLQQLNAKQVVIAFDADKARNANVQDAYNRLAKRLISWGYQVQSAEWPENEGKGIDDLLVAGGKYQLTAAAPSVNINRVRSGKNGKPVRKTDLAQPVSTITTTPDQLRTGMIEQLESHQESDTMTALLLKVPPGVGKTTTTMRHLRPKTDWRLIYSAPRHKLLQQSMGEGEIDWTWIRSRKPRQIEVQQATTASKKKSIEGYQQQDLPLNQQQVLCHQHQQADQLASKHWNVWRHLCRQCELLPVCGYNQQFQQQNHIGMVHQHLTNKRSCQSIMEEGKLFNPNQIVIVDELDPYKFVKTIAVSTKDLSAAIIRSWEQPLE